MTRKQSEVLMRLV